MGVVRYGNERRGGGAMILRMARQRKKMGWKGGEGEEGERGGETVLCLPSFLDVALSET